MASGLPSSKSASKNRAHTGLIRHGKPFFPLGLYLGQVEPDDLKTIGASKFNMIMPCAITDSCGFPLHDSAADSRCVVVPHVICGAASQPMICGCVVCGLRH